MDLIFHLLRTAPLPESVQLALTVNHRDDVAHNPSLSVAAWWRCWPTTGTLPVEITTALCSHPLDDEQLAHVAARETRVAAVSAALSNNDPDRVFAAYCARKRLPRPLADLFAGHLGPADGHADTVAAAASETVRVWRDVLSGDVSVAVQSILSTTPSGHDGRWRKLVSSWWQALVTVHPHTVTAVVGVDMPEDAALAAAGSPHLLGDDVQAALLDGRETSEWEWMHRALAANPTLTTATRSRLSVVVQRNRFAELEYQLVSSAARAVQTVPVTDVCDVQILDRLVRRAAPSEFRRHGRPWLAAVLTGNRSLTDGQRHDLCHPVDTLAGVPFAADIHHAAVDRLGTVPSSASIANPVGDVDLRLVTVHGFHGPFIDASAARGVAKLLGDDVGVWLAVIALADTFRGTVADLCATARALAA